MANSKNTFNSSITDKRTIPFDLLKTGTIATIGKDVIGTGTLFTTQVKVGDFLVDLTQNEVHKVVDISTNTLMHIQEAFGADIVAGTAIRISPSVPRPKEISLLIPSGGASGLIEGVTWVAGITWSSSKIGTYNNGRNDFINPIIADATGTNMLVTINY